MSSRAHPEKTPIIVHYVNSSETKTLCNLETKDRGGPRWLHPDHQDSKKYVDCPDCKNDLPQQKAPT